MNEKGNATLIGLLFMFSVSSWSILYLKSEVYLFQNLKSRLATFTCAKTLNGEVKTHVRWMEGLNDAILAANAIMAATIVKPPAFRAARAAKKAAQIAQEARHFSYLKKLWELGRKKCFYDPLAYTTPYRNKGLLDRDYLGRARLRKKKWKQATIGAQVILKTEVEKNGRWSTSLSSESYEIEEGLSLLKWASDSFSSAR